MGEITGYILTLRENRIEALNDYQQIDNVFAEPVPAFEHSRNVPLVCFVCDQHGNVIYLALGKRGQRAGTGLSRLNLSEIKKIESDIFLKNYVHDVTVRFRSGVNAKVNSGGLLTPKQFAALVDAIILRNEELGTLLRRYSSTRQSRIKALTSTARRELATQKEALVVAVGIAGYSRAELQRWEPPVTGAPTSFLDGLDQVRLREDQMVVHDLTNVPGYTLLKSNIHGTALFQGEDGSRLTVILANRLPLEQLTGTDLIYYNERFKSFVMVQYKAMEKTGEGEAIFRLPNEQLAMEVERMREILSNLEKIEEKAHHTGYRLSGNPFFLKLCSRIVFNPDDVALTPGMYIPLDQWMLMEKDEELVGKKGGRGVTFGNVQRHIDNTHFIKIVADAWVGSTPAQSAALEQAIRNTIESGRAVMVAVKTDAVRGEG